MERTVPSTASEEIELYVRTYYSLLRSSAEVQIRTLEEAHAGMHSLLHGAAREQVPDMSAFIYSIMRLPECVPQVRLVVLAQGLEVFARGGYPDVESWQPVSAAARRRKCFFNGKDILACFIASRSDIDDVVPLLTAYQIEWNKFHLLLQQLPASVRLDEIADRIDVQRQLADVLRISWEDLQRLQAIWGSRFLPNIKDMAAREKRFRLQLLNGSLSEYRRATNTWWENIESKCKELSSRPVYFVSSNTHSLANLLTGFALRQEQALVQYLDCDENSSLLTEWKQIESGHLPSSRENFLYYIMKKYQNSPEGEKIASLQRTDEQENGITRIPSEHSFDVEAQVIELSRLNPGWLDPRLGPDGYDILRRSDALILNIDYPLGLAAYDILARVAESVGSVLAVYQIGKSAALNAVIGDVTIPNVVHDEHSHNTYLFPNCFNAFDVSPYLMYGTVLDNQKAVTVLGTFLQNTTYMDVFYREGYTDIEMESGSYLSAVYEMYRPQRHPVNEIVNLYGIPFDLGIIHYVSDTPLSKGRNLGAGTLSYFGMDSTYAATIAVLRRILALERKRLDTGRYKNPEF